MAIKVNYRELEKSLPKSRSRLLPAGTRLADVPPDHRGTTWAEYECAWRDMVQALGLLPKEPVPEIKISTARDRYGWRSLPAGTRKLSF